jgi:hypothetical protein
MLFKRKSVNARELSMKFIVDGLLICCLATALNAQAVQAGQAAQSTQAASPGPSPAKSINMFAFPRNGQNSDQQLKDENDCYGLAKQQTGMDPQAPPPAGKSAEQKAAEQKAAADNAPKAQGGRARGAARGAAGGAAVGAIAGDAGKGAGAGAVAGTMKGGMQQRQANAASQKQAAAQTAAKQQKEEEQLKLAHAEGLDTFQRALCGLHGCAKLLGEVTNNRYPTGDQLPCKDGRRKDYGGRRTRL